MHGMMKNIPGPFEHPFVRRPRRKMTARSNSCTTFTQKKSEKGKVTMIRKQDNTVSRKAHTSAFGSSVTSGEREKKKLN